MKIAVLGYGVIGSGVVDLIKKNQLKINEKAGEDIDIKYILDIRDFSDSPYKDLFTKDFEVIVNDPEVKVVVEVIGGLEPAFTFDRRSLEAGKHVVTSNKELVSVHGCELLEIAKQKNLNFLFEASVGGGIPIIRPLHQCLAANEIESIAGILNGTTNYILTKMIEEGRDFDDALTDAQRLGYAERNPSADIDGLDSCRKTAILASLAYGIQIDPVKVYTEGIRDIKAADLKTLDGEGYCVKLLGVIKKKDEKLVCMVAPFILNKHECLLSTVNDVFNAIMVEGDAVGTSMFYGRGAGKMPTASAVVADVMDCCTHDDKRRNIFWSRFDTDVVADVSALKFKRFIRFDDGSYEFTDEMTDDELSRHIESSGLKAVTTLRLYDSEF